MFACALIIRLHRAFVSGRLLGEAGAPIEHCLLTDVEGEANSQKARSLRNLIPGFQSSLTLKHPGSIKVLENEVPEALPSLPLGEICSLETI